MAEHLTAPTRQFLSVTKKKDFRISITTALGRFCTKNPILFCTRFMMFMLISENNPSFCSKNQLRIHNKSETDIYY